MGIPCVSLSVVSHGQGPLVQVLLDDLASRRFSSVGQVVLTLNLPEAPPHAPVGGWPFELTLIHADSPQGFAANHNRAACNCKAEFLCVINPDIRFIASECDPFPLLCDAARQGDVGLAYPCQVSPSGMRIDYEREWPTPWALFKRYLTHRKEQRVDWVSGAFMVMRRSLFLDLGGLNIRFRMYCEDVEWCMRLLNAKYRIVSVPVKVVHQSQRASHRSLRHMIWHFHSLLRLWCNPLFWRTVRHSRPN